MANTLLTIGMITNEALDVLENNLTFTKRVNRDYDDEFGVAGRKIGDTVNVRKPVRYIGTRTPALSVSNSTETSVPVTLNNQYQVAMSFSTADMALSIDMFSDRFVKPGVAQMANMIDYDGLQQFYNVNGSVGTPGATPSALLTYLQAGVVLDNNAAPRDGERSVVLNPIAQATIVDNLKGLFQSSERISEQYEKGMMGQAIGVNWYMDQNVGTRTTGPLGGTPAINGAGQSGSSLVTDGWTAAAALRLRRGDVFTIDGVFSVNPQNYNSTGALMQFTVTSDVLSDGAGNATLPISPAIVLSGPFQNVSAAAADNALLNVVGAANTATPQNLMFHRDAFTFATCDLPIVGGTDICKRVSSKQLGMSIRMTRQYDINTDFLPTRLDLLGGWATLRPELAVRING